MLLSVLRAIWDFISATPTLVPVLLLPLTALLMDRTWRSLVESQRIAQWAAAGTLAFGILDWVLLAALPRLGLSFGPVGLPLLSITGVRLLFSLLLVWAWRWVGKRWTRLVSIRGIAVGVVLLWLGNLGVLICEIEGLYIEPFDLRVTSLSLSTPVELCQNPLSIVQISDLHVERTTKREKEVIEKVKALEPDIIVLTGDYLSTSYIDDPIARRDARWLLEQLHAPYGVFAVTAMPVDTTDAVAELFDGLDITVLQDEVRRVEIDGSELYLVGISLLERERDWGMLPQLMKQVPEDAYSLLLYHTPDMVEVAAEEKVNLYLAGHTHGGQIRLPLFGAVITASEHGKKYEQGRYTVGETTLYVSRGIGMEGKGAPRARFLCPPEIVAVELESLYPDK
ncbi:MAG: metallophosphoesterase [Chloroflexota bacterium]|nr:metallophosphoesterase [Chloroflexota bacterium]